MRFPDRNSLGQLFGDVQKAAAANQKASLNGTAEPLSI